MCIRDRTRTYVGKNGGFAVNKPAQQIDLLSIIRIMENTVKINRCLEEDEYCSRFATATCPVRSFYCILQDELESKLSSITIKSLLDGSKAVSYTHLSCQAVSSRG